ncbi:hypothetical protein QLL95_gp1289 [Cotonvirus japonicus]|uniref:Uncharacterized protein n=1 Tax=Cotonvirus japonicus TaxID=2811091 RepID=A0ABM7NRP8_9VIRU|nr:hypothetical protein QLL95_gp1289 [Cotonvirus japonicus]BCS82834.1 hypothetical protein [Cotonvirus japonicus]
MYKQKYRKYKLKYKRLKKSMDGGDNAEKITEALQKRQGIYNNADDNYKNVDLALFFDLWQMSRDILTLTSESSIIIIIGDTPSYVKPLIEDERTVYNLAFSNKPFGCFNFPYGNELPRDVELYDGTNLLDVYTPTADNLQHYFDYLNTKTFLTKKYVLKNWEKIVLLDSSSGQSIMGVSIFFNRYVGHILNDSIDEINCLNVTGAKPLKFIRVVNYSSSTTNTTPKLAQEYFSSTDFNTNYKPDLIIYIGYVVYEHRDDFMLMETYERYVPGYSVRFWNQDPDTNLELGLQNLTLLKRLSQLYIDFKKNPTLETSKPLIKYLTKDFPVPDDENLYTHMKTLTKDTTPENLNSFLDGINLRILARKYYYYFNV